MKTVNERGSPLARYLDLSLGVPSIFFLQLFKKRGTLGGINKIAILQTAAIGDTVLMSAAVTNLRNSYKDAVIDVFCGTSNADAVRLIDGIDNVIVIPVKHPCRSIKAIREKGEYDIWFDFGPWPRINAIYSFFSLSRFTVGFNTKGQYRHFLYDKTVLHSSIHEIDNQLHLIGFLVNNPVRELSIISPEISTDNKLIVFHPFPGGSKLHLKKWPDSRWNKLAEFLLNKGCHIKVTGGQENNLEAKQMFQDISSRPEFEIVAGVLSLKDTVKLLKTARLVISVDTGVMHLASALGVDLISLHGPTAPERWGPLNKNSTALIGEIDCSPCLGLGFESKCKENRCMKNISVEQVIEAEENLLPTAH